MCLVFSSSLVSGSDCPALPASAQFRQKLSSLRFYFDHELQEAIDGRLEIHRALGILMKVCQKRDTT